MRYDRNDTLESAMRNLNPPRSQPAGSDPGIERGFALCRAAEPWRRTADAIVAPVGLTQFQFLILHSTHALCLRIDDAVSQNEVAAVAGVSKMRTSKAMGILARRGLVSRGPSGLAFAYRVFVTARGEEVLCECRARLLACQDALEVAGRFGEWVGTRSG